MRRVANNFWKIPALGALALPLVIAVASLISGWLGLLIAEDAGFGWVVVGFAIAVLNAHLSFLRPMLYARRNDGSMVGYRNVSGFPLVGTMFALIGIVFSWGHLGVALFGVAVIALDPGGAISAFVAVCRDNSLRGVRK